MHRSADKDSYEEMTDRFTGKLNKAEEIDLIDKLCAVLIPCFSQSS